jgi:hypothetical protein
VGERLEGKSQEGLEGRGEGGGSLHMWNDPLRSISITVLNPFGDKSSAGDMKFPAAQFTRISSRPNAATAAATTPSHLAKSRTSPCQGPLLR